MDPKKGLLSSSPSGPCVTSPGCVPRGAAKRKAGASPLNFHSGNHNLNPHHQLVSGGGNLLHHFPSAPVLPPLLTPPPPVSMSGTPLNESELQLYRVLQRANLLMYYDTFIAQGGDDVHQLCEAGEEEFLEIMALVGMASKPLHVRRLQKALQEWVQNPGKFQAPFIPSGGGFPMNTTISLRGTSPSTTTPPPSLPTPSLPIVVSPGPPLQQPSNGINGNNSNPHSQSSAPSSPGSKDVVVLSPSSVASPTTTTSACASPTLSQGGSSTSEYPPQSTSPVQLTPVLMESQIQKIADTADLVIKSLPPSFELKVPANKKKITKELEAKNYVLSMSDDDPRKAGEIRRFSAIYGRFDCKRKAEKPLTLHEVSVNEAAAQLCQKMPALLIRRDELFPLARQVVRDSGYQYSKGHSRSQFSTGFPSKLFGGCVNSVAELNGNSNINNNNGDAKRLKLNPDSAENELKKKERLESVQERVRQLNAKVDELHSATTLAKDTGDITTLHSLNHQIDLLQTKQSQLLQGDCNSIEYKRFNTRSSTSSERERMTDTDEETSTNAETSSMMMMATSSPTDVVSNILSTSGGQIIAVQNPALLMRNSIMETGPASCTRSTSSSSSSSSCSSSSSFINPTSSSKLNNHRSTKRRRTRSKSPVMNGRFIDGDDSVE